MKKSLLAFVLAFSLVLSVAVPAFAATPTDVSGTKEQSAIEELVALGIINGYADGTFKPNNNITRAELAKIIVSATGGANAAALMQAVPSTFKDVKVNEWYTGFINVAATKGFILGDLGTGKFRPNDNVKFEEVVAIVIRAIGFSDKNLLGAWPYNVLVKAEDIGLFNKVEITPGTLATRGIVAQITNNGLNEQLVQWDADKELYSGVYDKNDNAVLLISKLGTTETALLTESALKNTNQVELNGGLKTTATNFIVTGGKKLSDLLGHSVTVLYNTDGKVLAISDAQSADSIISGVAKAVLTATSTKINVKVGDTTSDYNYAVNSQNAVVQPYFFKNGDDAAYSDITVDLNVKLVLNSKGAVVAVLGSSSVGDALFESIIEKTSANDARLVYDGGFVKINDNTSYTLNGEKAAVADLKENDVLVITANADNFALKVEATRKVVEGKVTGKSKSNGDWYVTIAATKYKLTSLVDNEGLTVDGEYKLFLNKDGAAVKVDVIKPGAAANDQAIVINWEANQPVAGTNGVVANKDILTYYSVKEDKVITVQLAVSTPDYDDYIGRYVTLTFDGDKVNGIKLDAENTLNEKLTLSSTVKVDEITTSKITLVTTAGVKSTYTYNGNTGIINATDVSVGDDGAYDVEGTIKAGKIADITKNDRVFIVTDASGYNASYIVLVEDNEATTDKQTTFGGKLISVDQDTVAGSTTYSVTIQVNGSNKTLAITSGLYGDLSVLDSGDNIFLSVEDNNTANLAYDNAIVTYNVADEDSDVVGSVVTAATSSSKVFDTAGGKYFIDTDSSIYVIEADGTVKAGNFSDISAAKNTNVAYVSTTDGTLGDRSIVSVVVIVK